MCALLDVSGSAYGVGFATVCDNGNCALELADEGDPLRPQCKQKNETSGHVLYECPHWAHLRRDYHDWDDQESKKSGIVEE